MLHAITAADPLWTAIGMVGQVVFTGRFVLQLWFSERAGRPVNPIHFWYLSMGGSVLLFCYAVAQRDPIIILGQSFGIVVYLRNLALIRRQAQADGAGARGH
ncbi:lipid-A-disaccharide synthase N-terminal domain-containing protein [Pseudomonas citronellolis]|uniref:lipid-A-disaccharide synthase N-terminal domain-containing protein n=1 Tax=Pseudomonas citronellolis TaxID=53408 RepID=UPI0023E37970|nr:lipid-A-disaccharide synthase N-terminal domain-containing protein [Pseudomonas citronellolis]MDF3933061.1 lipid-A-disaccharide synthase N-terminal domain-containing protein [Pseudomonas citronellolis]